MQDEIEAAIIGGRKWKLAVVVVIDFSQIPTLCLIWSPPLTNAEKSISHIVTSAFVLVNSDNVRENLLWHSIT